MYNLTNMYAMGNTQEIPFADKQPAFKKMFSIAEVARMSHDELRKYHISQKSYWDACSVLEGARTGLYSYIAHPDILNFTGDYRLFISEMDRLVEGIVKEDLPLEINILGLREGRHYPREDFLALVSKHGGKMIVGCDAHRPQDVYDEPTVQRALALLEKYGIERTEQVDIHRLEKLL